LVVMVRKYHEGRGLYRVFWKLKSEIWVPNRQWRPVGKNSCTFLYTRIFASGHWLLFISNFGFNFLKSLSILNFSPLIIFKAYVPLCTLRFMAGHPEILKQNFSL
jgi:hypothetical protein